MKKFYYVRKTNTDEMWSELSKGFTKDLTDASKYANVKRAQTKVKQMLTSSDVVIDLSLEIVTFFKQG